MPTENEMQKSLIEYLAESKPLAEEEITITPSPAPVVTVVETVVPPDPREICDERMLELLGCVKRIGMCAKDLHYRAKGKPFYGLHELADLIWKIEQDTDQIVEIYFMGTRGKEPPLMTDVFAKAIDTQVLYPRDNNYFIGGLMGICRRTMLTIEAIKKDFPDLPAGMHAVLDSISQQCLLSIGLLDQTLKN